MSRGAVEAKQIMKLKKDRSDFTARMIEKQRSLFEQQGVPLTPEGTAPINDHLARTALFAPIKRGKRKMHRGTVLASQADAKIKVYGEQLDMTDQNVLLHAYRLAAGVKPLDDAPPQDTDGQSRVVVNRAEFLRAIGMVASGRNYTWLHSSLIRLASCIIEVDTAHYTASYHLVGPPQFDKDTEEYYFHIPKASFAFFANAAYGYVNMNRRLALKVQTDLASWIQAFAVSHSKCKEHVFSLAYLKDLCGQTRPMRKFRIAFKEAVAELLLRGEFEYAHVSEDDKFYFKAINEGGATETMRHSTPGPTK